jgi:Phage tail assembly chaperone protein
MTAVIYSIVTGEILRVVNCPPSCLGDQAQTGEEFFLNCPSIATHIRDGEPVMVPPTTDDLLTAIRVQRDGLLAGCDWTQLPDAPEANKATWAVYRQALRDFPETCNAENPIWPVRPE